MESAQKTKEVLNVKTFRTAVVTAEGSKTFLKKLLPTAVSFILHQRINFDKGDFVPLNHNGIKYTTFKPKLKNETLLEIKKWLENAFDALDKNYLRELYLIFGNEDQPDHIVESYKFQFVYFGDTENYLENAVTKEELRESTKTLLETIGALSVHEFLDQDKTEIKMALTYFENVTPSDYHPPLFGCEETDKNSLIEIVSSHSPYHCKIGYLSTGFHSVKCRARGDIFSMDKSFNSVPDTEDGLKLIDEQDERGDDVWSDAIDADDEDIRSTNVECSTNSVALAEFSEEPKNKRSQNIDASSTLHDLTKLSCEILMNESESDNFINCSCRISTKIDKIDLIECSKCSTLQHSACYGYLSADDVKKPYICKMCHYPELTPTESKAVEKNSIWRLVIAIIYLTEQYPSEILNKVSPNIKQLVSRIFLEKEVITETNGSYLPNLQMVRSVYVPQLFANMKQLPESIAISDEETVGNLKPGESVQEPQRKRQRRSRSGLNKKY